MAKDGKAAKAAKKKETLEETIKRLPKSADKIAEFFKSQGVKGYRMDSSGCPLARWLKRQGHWGAYVTFWDNGKWYCKSRHVSLPTFLPVSASAFAKRFDAGKYPDLVAGNRTGAKNKKEGAS